MFENGPKGGGAGQTGTTTGQSGRNARILAGFVRLLDAEDLGRLNEYLTDDVVMDWPQSGERVRGIDNFREIVSGYPGRDRTGFRSEPILVAGEEPHYVMTPTFNLVRVQGSGDSPVFVAKLHYPDGSTWYMIGFCSIREDKIARQTTYFAPEYPAPDWRTQWVEPLA
jgi:hypothetical protein